MDQNGEFFTPHVLSKVPNEMRDELKGLEQVMNHFSKMVQLNTVPCLDKKDEVIKYEVYALKNSSNKPLEDEFIKSLRECKHKYYVEAVTNKDRNLRYYFGLNCNDDTTVTLLTIHEKADDNWKKAFCENK
jgi:hypothetical protein